MNKRSKTSKSSKSNIDFTLIPILITLGILPLVVRLNFISTPSADSVWQTEDTLDIPDLFAYSKGSLLILMAIISIIIIIYKHKTSLKALSENKPFYLLYGYLGLIILSFIFSVNQHLSLIGYQEHYENVFILISYIILFLITAISIKNEKQLQSLINTFAISSILLFLIGITQYFSHDIITSALGDFFVKPAEYNNFNFTTDSDTLRNVYQTLYHYNYVSFFVAIGLPFFLVLTITEKNVKPKVLYSTLTAMFAISQIISLSRNGYIGIIISIFVIMIVFGGRLLKHWRIALPSVLVIGISLILFVTMSETLTAIRLRNGLESLTLQKEDTLKDINTIGNTLEIDHQEFYIEFLYYEENNTNAFLYLDKNNQALDLVTEGKLGYFSNIPQSTFQFEHGNYNGNPAIMIIINKKQWLFTVVENEFFMLTPDSTLTLVEEAPAFGFEGYETFASARGYIWSRTIPLLSDYWLLGSGPDTYPIVFPQNDFVGKFNSYNTPYMTVDKPHNIYLNYAIHTGLISLILLLIFWGIYVVNSFKLYTFKPINNLYSRIGVASFAAVMGYLASGIFNDTNLNVTPVFWIILGVGYTANKIVKQQTN